MKLPLGKFLLLFGLLIIFNSMKAQQHEWAKAIKSKNSSNHGIFPFNINSFSNGSVLTSGVFTGKFDFNPNNQSSIIDSSGINNGFFNKLDSNGNLLWNKNFKGGSIHPYGVYLDYRNNTLIAGRFSDSLSIDSTKTLYAQNNTNIFVTKLTKNKTLSFGKTLGDNISSSCHNIITDSENNIFMIGTLDPRWSPKTVDMDPSDSSEFNIFLDDMVTYLLKLDSNGVFQWVKTFDFNIHSIGINQFDQLFFHGRFIDTLIIQTSINPDTLISQNSTLDYFFGRISNMGNIIWVNSLQSSSSIQVDTQDNIPTDRNGNIYLSGNFSTSISFNDTTLNLYTSKGRQDGYICKVDSNGNFGWLKVFGGIWYDNIKSSTIDDSSNLYLGVELSGIIYFPTDTQEVGYLSSPNKNYSLNLIKFNTEGVFKWAKPIKTNFGIGTISSIDWSKATNSIYSTGIYHQELIARDTLTADNRNNLYIAKTKLCDPIPFYDTLYLCAGDSTYIPNVKTKHAGNYSQLVENNSGCDSIRYTHLVVYPSYPDTSIYSFCEGDSLLYQGNYYSKDTLFRYAASTAQGCDSSRIVLIQSDTDNVTEFIGQICEADTFYFNNQEYFQSGTYLDTLQAISGCDSILKLNLTVNPKSYFQQNISICEGDFYPIGNSKYTQSGTYKDTLSNNFGCDSIVTTFLSVDTLPISEQHITICEGGSYSIGFSTYTQAGTYSDTLYRFNDCDSVVITHLSLTQKEDSTINITLCEGESTRINNQSYSRSGNYTQYLNFGGCQITLNINVEVLPKKRSTQSFALCVGDSVQVGNQVYSESGTYTNNFLASNGCDSIVTTKISIPEFDIILNENSLNVFPKESYENVRYLWYNCDSKRVLYEETDNRFEFKLSGHYAPIVILDNCRDTLICNQVTYYGDYELKVFPNPAKDVCTIVVPTAGKLKLYTSNGSLVHEYYFSRSREYIYQIPETATGLYFVVFEGEEGILTEKLSIVD